MVILLSLLIIYGFVLIVTRGSIFEGPRGFFNTFVQNQEKYFYPLKEDVIQLLNNDSVDIDLKYLENYIKLLSIPDDKDFPELMQTLLQKCQTQIIEKRRKNIPRRLFVWILKKLNKLVNCQMCLGFWAGISLALVTIYNPIVLFTLTIQIMTGLNALALFAFGLLSAGSTWAIDQFIEYFSNNQNQ